MKTKLNLGKLKIEEIGIELENISVEAEYSPKELIQLVDVVKYATASIPEILENLANGFLTFEALDNFFEEESAKENEEYMENCCPVQLPKKQESIINFLNQIVSEVKRKETIKEVKEVAKEDTEKAKIEEVLADFEADLESKGFPKSLQQVILKNLKEDIDSGKIIIK